LTQHHKEEKKIMSRYLDPKADVTFKKIFADHPNLLISFLNAVLPLPSDRIIVEIFYLPTEQVPEIPEFKRTVVDVKCTDSTGRVFIVEMQMNWTTSFKQRLLFGTSSAFVKQLDQGEQYHLLQPVYGLGLIAEKYNKNDLEWYHHYQLVKLKQGTMNGDIIEHLQLVFIELPKFPVSSPSEKKLRLLWLRFLREIDETTTKVSQELLDVPEIAQAIELVQESAYTPAELSIYQSYWDQVSREKTLMHDKYTEGRAEGKAEGEAIGEARGEARGRTDEKREIAINMLKDNELLDKISRFTGLSLDDIAKLKNEIE
jgi:predicted transposase/invertase (TIGR01784 family)